MRLESGYVWGKKNEPGSQEYYDSIIRMYADWGVDFIKCDDICNIDTEPTDAYSSAHEIEMLAKAIENPNGKSFFLFHRDRQESSGHGIMKNMQTCGESQMTSGMTGNYWHRCSGAVSCGRIM